MPPIFPLNGKANGRNYTDSISPFRERIQREDKWETVNFNPLKRSKREKKKKKKKEREGKERKREKGGEQEGRARDRYAPISIARGFSVSAIKEEQGAARIA